MLFGTISGMVVSAVMVLVILASAVFFNQIRDYQQCVRHALTQQATSACQTQLQNSCPRSCASCPTAAPGPNSWVSGLLTASRSASRSFCWRSSQGPGRVADHDADPHLRGHEQRRA